MIDTPAEMIHERCHKCGEGLLQKTPVLALEHGEWLGEWTCPLCQMINSYSEPYEKTIDPDELI
jgi:phage FluMu protein Com